MVACEWNWGVQQTQAAQITKNQFSERYKSQDSSDPHTVSIQNQEKVYNNVAKSKHATQD